VPGVSILVQKQQQQEIMSGEVKEVDEWVDTAEKSGIIDKQADPCASPDNLNGKSGEAEDDNEDWMFKTFSRLGNKKPPKAPKIIPAETPPEADTDDFGENL